MPRFGKNCNRGYDLDLELDFWESDGERYLLGSAGSFIMICPICAEQHFRERISEHERCFEGHGQMIPYKVADREKYNALWLNGGLGRRITTIEERRKERLKRENPNSIYFQFGEKTEADFPKGYVESTDDA